MNMRPPTRAIGAPRAREESLLMYRVATMHFVDRLSNLEISRNLGISRFRVARLLEQSVSLGDVKTRVAFPSAVDLPLSEQLERTFRLQSASVSGQTGDDRWRAAGVSSLAVHLVGELLEDGAQLGLSWGRTLESVTECASHLILDLPRADIVQLVGGVPSSGGGLEASDLVRRFSLLTGGQGTVLNGPLLVPTRAIADSLRSERSIAAALSAGASADVALFSVGAWKPGQSMLWDLLSDDDRLLGERDGVVADICGVIVTAAGEVAMSDLSERIIAIGASALRRIPRRVAVVLGTDKTDALISALRSGLITDLVVEADAARALLKAG